MTKEYFKANVIMAVEIEYDGGGRRWREIKCSNLRAYLDKIAKSEDKCISDIDYCTEQEDAGVKEIIDKATEIWMDSEKRKGFKSYDEVIDSLLEEAPKAKRIWTEEEIRELVQTNDKVLYGALRKLYAEQTVDEKADGDTKYHNGVGFNGVDAKIMSSFAEFLKRTGFLTEKQKAVARKKLVKYNKQLTRLANA